MTSQNVDTKEFYTNYDPPCYALNTVRALLASVPEKYLQGLDCVVLTNQSGQSRKHRLGKISSRQRRLPQSDVLGLYHRAHRGKRPWIELYVDNIDSRGKRTENSYGVFPLPFILLGDVLFHEIGHHIHLTMIPEHREKEDVAEDWKMKLLRNYVAKILSLEEKANESPRRSEIQLCYPNCSKSS